MNILLIGQCTLHWGRMEFGNIGNNYIIEPFVRELHRRYPGATIRTTMQMSEDFCAAEGVTVLPMKLYYDWRANELDLAKSELEMAERISVGAHLDSPTPYIEAVQESDLVIDFSGDIWGDNANLLGPDRFEVGLLKDQVAITLGKPVVMLAGSPGPFNTPRTAELAKGIYSQFHLVTNREPVSTRLLEKEGFDVTRTQSLACPAFLFEPAPPEVGQRFIDDAFPATMDSTRPMVGFILCGWNFLEGPFDRWPRDDSEYDVFIDAVTTITKDLGANVCLMSHSNGFEPAAEKFRLRHGRDYPVIKQLQAILESRGLADGVFALDGVYNPHETKSIIGRFDMLVTGRIHAATAGWSGHVPTVVIDYGHPPKAHKLHGFAEVVTMQDLVADPAVPGDLEDKIKTAWSSRSAIRAKLAEVMPKVQAHSRANFEILPGAHE